MGAHERIAAFRGYFADEKSKDILYLAYDPASFEASLFCLSELMFSFI